MENQIKRIAIITSDQPIYGINVIIHAIILTALNRRWECFGILDGYRGLLFPEEYRGGGLIRLDREEIASIYQSSNNILDTGDTQNSLSRHDQPYQIENIVKIIQAIDSHSIDALVTIGGDEVLLLTAKALYERGIHVIGISETIENHPLATAVSLGFSSIVNFVIEYLDRLRSAGDINRNKIVILELSGRNASWIALNSGLSSMVDVILIPEIPYDIKKVTSKITKSRVQGSVVSIILVVNGSLPENGASAQLVPFTTGEKLATNLKALTDEAVETIFLEDLLEGGSLSSSEYLFALRLGAAAVRGLSESQWGKIAVLTPFDIRYVPLERFSVQADSVPLDCDTILTAHNLGICLGD